MALAIAAAAALSFAPPAGPVAVRAARLSIRPAANMQFEALEDAVKKLPLDKVPEPAQPWVNAYAAKPALFLSDGAAILLFSGLNPLKALPCWLIFFGAAQPLGAYSKDATTKFFSGEFAAVWAASTLGGVVLSAPFAGTLDGGVGLLAKAIGRAMDLVDQTNAVAKLPGSSVLSGATLGTRRLVRGVNAAASAVLGGVSGGAKAVVSSKPTPVGVLRGVERGVGALHEGLKAGTAAALEGVDGGASSLLDGIESFASLEGLGLPFLPGMGLLTSAVHGVADAARGSVRAATSGAASVAGGVLEGGASAVGGAAGGLSQVVGGVADGTLRTFDGLLRGGLSVVSGVSDGVVGVAQSAAKGDGAGMAEGGLRLLDGVLSGSGHALDGLIGGTEHAVRGTFGGLSYFGKGVVSGAGAMVSGVLSPTEQAARKVAELWPLGGSSQGGDAQRESCTAHRVRQGASGALLARLGLRAKRGGKWREVVVCTSSN